MAKCIVIADDLTGANATGVLLKKMNYEAITVMDSENINDELLKKSDCLLYPTDSRGISKELAYKKIYNICNSLKSNDVEVYSDRIDSTMRGNVGSEIDAMLDSLGEDYIAIVAACFPSSERVVLGGYMLVKGLPLHKTDIAIDPKTPVKRSDVAGIIREQSKYNVANIFTKDLMNGKHYLANQILEKVETGARIIVIDSITQEDLDLIADAVITSKIKFICVDPGVFTATMSRKLIKPTKVKKKNRILAVVGSVNQNTKIQMEELWLSQRTHNVFVETKKLLEGSEEKEKEISRVVNEILKEADKNIVSTVTGDGIYPENRIDFNYYISKLNCPLESITNMINTAFAEIALRIIKNDSSFKGLYSSGGDITIAICNASKAAGLDLKDEVLPLAAYGKFLEGEFDGLDIVTKGGSQGNRDAINKCITYLKEKLFI